MPAMCVAGRSQLTPGRGSAVRSQACRLETARTSSTIRRRPSLSRARGPSGPRRNSSRTSRLTVAQLWRVLAAITAQRQQGRLQVRAKGNAAGPTRPSIVTRSDPKETKSILTRAGGGISGVMTDRVACSKVSCHPIFFRVEGHPPDQLMSTLGDLRVARDAIHGTLG